MFSIIHLKTLSLTFCGEVDCDVLAVESISVSVVVEITVMSWWHFVRHQWFLRFLSYKTLNNIKPYKYIIRARFENSMQRQNEVYTVDEFSHKLGLPRWQNTDKCGLSVARGDQYDNLLSNCVMTYLRDGCLEIKSFPVKYSPMLMKRTEDYI